MGIVLYFFFFLRLLCCCIVYFSSVVLEIALLLSRIFHHATYMHVCLLCQLPVYTPYTLHLSLSFSKILICFYFISSCRIRTPLRPTIVLLLFYITLVCREQWAAQKRHLRRTSQRLLSAYSLPLLAFSGRKYNCK